MRMSDEQKKLMDEIEVLLKNDDLVTSISRVDNYFEMFMENEKIPIRTHVKFLENYNPEIGRYESFMQYKVGHDPQHHFSLNILHGQTLADLALEMIDNYLENMKGTLGEVRNGFKKDVSGN